MHLKGLPTAVDNPQVTPTIEWAGVMDILTVRTIPDSMVAMGVGYTIYYTNYRLQKA